MSQQITGYKTDRSNINVPPLGQFIMFQDETTGFISTRPHDNPNNITAVGGEVLVANSGIASLSTGTIIVTFPTITANSLIFLTAKAKGGVTPGVLTYTINAGVGFTIDSTNGADTSDISWLVIVK